MSSLAGLFIEAPNMVPSSPEKLSSTPEAWGEEITNKIRSRYPVTQSLTIGIHFTKKDEENGAAIGNAIIMTPQQDKRAYIPLIIKSNKLYPLDIFLKEDPTHPGKLTANPLTPDRLTEALMNNQTWAHLERPDEFFQRIYGQLGALGVGGTHGLPPKFASAYLLQHVLPLADKSAHESLRSEMLSNKSYLMNYEKNASFPVLKYAMTPHERPATKIAGEMPVAAVVYAKNRDNSLLDLISVETETFTPSVDVRSAESWCGTVSRFANVKEHIHDLLRHGETIVEHPERPIVEAVTLTAPHQRTGEGTDLKRHGMVCLRTLGGAFTEGVLFPVVIDFDMNPTPYKLFIGRGHSSVASNFVGEMVRKEVSFEISKRPIPGDFGSFVYFNPEGKALATVPVEIVAEEGGTYTVKDLYGMRFRVSPQLGGGSCAPCPSEPYSTENDKPSPVGDPKTYSLLKVTKLKDRYILPNTFRFVPMKNLTEMSDLYGMGKYARDAGATPIRVTHTGGNMFALAGLGVEKTAYAAGWSPQMLNEKQAMFLIASRGAALTKAAEALQAARTYSSIDVNGLSMPDRPQAKVAAPTYSGASALARCLFKEASFFDDSQVVDHLLSLNFVNEDNAALFAAQIPALDETARILAQMVLAARLGMNAIPEGAASGAMSKLVDVIEGLKSMKGSLYNA